MVKLLIFLIPFSLFSINLYGFSFYLPYLLSFVGICAFAKYLIELKEIEYKFKSLYFYVLLFFLYILFSIILKPFLIKDLIKIIVFIFLFIGLRFYFLKDQYRFMKIMDWSILVLVAYGLVQYLAINRGYGDVVVYLHSAIGFEGFGGPYNVRAGVTRVASLTKEPSYFCFITGMYFFIAKSKFMKAICLIGLYISFSIIFIYVLIGLVLYKTLKVMRLNSLYTMTLIVVLHTIFVSYFFDSVPLLFKPTFADRYLGITEFLKFGFMEGFFGSFSVNSSYHQTLFSPFSNIGSVLYLLGVIGLFFYLNIYYFLEKNSKLPTACIALFLFGFNFYYLTAWPIVIAFYVILINYNPERCNKQLCLNTQ